MAQVAMPSVAALGELLRAPSEEAVRTKKDESLQKAVLEDERQIDVQTAAEAAQTLDMLAEAGVDLGSFVLQLGDGDVNVNVEEEEEEEEEMAEEYCYDLTREPSFDFLWSDSCPSDALDYGFTHEDLRIEELAEDWETCSSSRLYNAKRGGRTERSTTATKVSHKLDQDDLRVRRQKRIHHSQLPEPGDARNWRVTCSRRSAQLASKQRNAGRDIAVITAAAAAPAPSGSRRARKKAAKKELLERERAAKRVEQYTSAAVHAYDMHEAYQPYREPTAARPPAQPQRYELRAPSRATQRERILEQLQYRELTPEDYDILLALDESVAPKTVSASVVSAFETFAFSAEASLRCASCAVCMGDFESGQQLIRLPCKHEFHAECIQQWLTSSSHICPIDGISLLPS